jgi:sigma-B regulation protein RsbU (phosphoserine phosphatase)
MRLANERMRQELEAARIIQQSFLPGRLPGADDPRFSLGAINHPAAAVGGDYYDVIPIGRNRLGLVLGDVSGKGVPGAIYMARLVSDFRFLVDAQENSPAETLIALNRILLGRGQPGMFVTLLYLTLNMDTGFATFANAGHLPLLVRRAQGKVDTLDRPAGPPLGIVEDIVYDNAEVALTPGEDLLLFTDGVTEAMNPAREQFTQDRLVEVLGRAPTCPEALVTVVAEAVRVFAGEAPVHDDLTLLAARWEG